VRMIKIDARDHSSMWVMPMYVRRINNMERDPGCIVWLADDQKIFCTEEADDVAGRVSDAMNGMEVSLASDLAE